MFFFKTENKSKIERDSKKEKKNNLDQINFFFLNIRGELLNVV